jgi:glycine cleavage system H protein
MQVSEGLLYSKEHVWVKKEGEKAYIGITDFSQEAMGSINHVGLPAFGKNFSAGDNFVVIEAVKASTDVHIPIDGTVIEVNNAVADKPSLLNEDPYKNWIIIVKNLNNSQLEKLMKADEYREFCAEKK